MEFQESFEKNITPLVLIRHINYHATRADLDIKIDVWREF